MSFFDWFRDDSDESKLGKFWKKLTGFFKGKSSSDEIKDEVNSTFVETAEDVVNREFIPLVVQNIKDGDHIYTGYALNNIYVESTGDDNIEVGIRDAAYFGRVEFGTDPRPVSSNEFLRLVAWVSAKHPNIENPYPLAEFVKQKIQNEGNTEYAPFSNALEASEDKMSKEIRDGLIWRFDRG